MSGFTPFGASAFGAGGFIPFATAPGMTLTYLGHNESNTNVAAPGNYTVSAADMGTASSDRYIVIGIVSAALSTATINAPTVGGVTLTQAGDDPAGDATFCSFWYGNVPSGTTGDIVITVATGTLLRMSVNWWSITGSAQTAPTTVSDNPTKGANSTTITTTGFTVPAGGVSLCLARSNLVAVAPTLSGTQTTVNVRDSRQTAGESQWAAAGDASGSGSGQTWTFATNDTSGSLNIVAIVWEP